MNNRDQLNRIVSLFIALVMGLLSTGCSAGKPPVHIQTPVPFQTASPANILVLPTSAPELPTSTLVLPTSTLPAPVLTFRVMAYNILFGAGVEPGHAEQKNNHLNDLISLVQQADPDILGLEEVSGWESGYPSAIEQFSSALNLNNYYLAPNPMGLNTAIFSKYPILETQNLSGFGSLRALRALVQLPDGNKINVVVVHLNPENEALRSCEFDKLRSLMESYHDQPGILMGDLNTLIGNTDAKYLTQAGWELVTGVSIDNILIRSGKAWSGESICFQRGTTENGCIGDAGISDHLPVGAVISFYDLPNATSPELTTTPARPYGCFSDDDIRPFADPILAAVAKQTPDFQDDFSDPASGWPDQVALGTRGYVSGEYFLRTAATQNAYTSSESNSAVPRFTDMLFEVESHFETGQAAGHFSIKFARIFSNGKHADVSVSLFSDGRLDLKWEPGGTLVTKRVSPASAYRFQIIMRQNEIAVYVNDQPLIYYDTSHLSPDPAANTFRFEAAAHEERSVEVRLDNLRIWDISDLARP